MSKRNAHAVAARQRKAGAHEDEKAKQDLADRARDLFDELEVWELQQLLELAAKISK